jgi:hypothetical protein
MEDCGKHKTVQVSKMASSSGANKDVYEAYSAAKLGTGVTGSYGPGYVREQCSQPESNNQTPGDH